MHHEGQVCTSNSDRQTAEDRSNNETHHNFLVQTFSGTETNGKFNLIRRLAEVNDFCDFLNNMNLRASGKYFYVKRLK